MELISEDVTHHTRKTYKMDMLEFMGKLGIDSGKIDSCSPRLNPDIIIISIVTPGHTKSRRTESGNIA